jgi:hypothetical protein
MQRVSRDVGDDLQAQPTRAGAANLDRDGDKRLLTVLAPALQAFLETVTVSPSNAAQYDLAGILRTLIGVASSGRQVGVWIRPTGSPRGRGPHPPLGVVRRPVL